MKQLKQSELDAIHREIQETLDNIGKEYDVSLAVKKVEQNKHVVTAAIRGAVIDGEPEIDDTYQEALSNHAKEDKKFKLSVGDKVLLNNREFTLVGYKRRNTRRPIMATDPIGRLHYLSKDRVLAGDKVR